jgi:hypothetical protein
MSSAAATTADRSADVLRLLGRVEFARARWIHALLFPDRDPTTTWRILRALHAAQLIWMASVPAVRVPGAIRARNRQAAPRAPTIYGLTPEGRNALAALGIEGDRRSVPAMPVRAWAEPDLKLAQLRHDLLVSDWCCALLNGARRHPHLHSVGCQVEYISATSAAGQAIQRIDALVQLTFAPVPLAPRPPWMLPWADGTASPVGAITCRLAAEIDTGSEKLAILLGKAGTYRALTYSGHYTATLGGPVLPVVLVPPGTRRAAQIAREWRDGWPEGAGLISSFAQAQVADDAIHGRYLVMASNPAQPAFLLEPFGIARDAWDTAIAHQRHQGAADHARKEAA